MERTAESRVENATGARRFIAGMVGFLALIAGVETLYRMFFLKFAVNGWSMLNTPLFDPRPGARSGAVELIVIQIVGGIAAAVAVRPSRTFGAYLKLWPLFTVIFFLVTCALFIAASSVHTLLTHS